MIDVLLIMLLTLMFVAYCALFIAPVILLVEGTDNGKWAWLFVVTIPLMVALLVVGVECWGVLDWVTFSDCFQAEGAK